MKNELKVIHGDGDCMILLYGEIGVGREVVSEDFVEALLRAEKAGHRVTVHINSPGGCVYHGMAIYNAIRNSKANIRIHVDGMAASMAGIIALCGKPLYMNQHSRLMLHCASTTMRGNSSDFIKAAGELSRIENDLAFMIAERIGKQAEEVKKTFFDGEDHWISSQEALDMGLVDGILAGGANPKTDDPGEMYMEFRNALEGGLAGSLQKKLKGLPSFANLADNAAILKHIKELERKAAAYDREGMGDTHITAALASLKQYKEVGESELGMMSELAANAPASFLQFAKKRMLELEAAKEERFAEIVRSKNLRARFESPFVDKEIKRMAWLDLDAFEKVASKFYSPLRASEWIRPGELPSGDTEDRTQWTLSDYRKKAPLELAENPMLYKSLLAKEQGGQTSSYFQG